MKQKFFDSLNLISKLTTIVLQWQIIKLDCKLENIIFVKCFGASLAFCVPIPTKIHTELK